MLTVRMSNGEIARGEYFHALTSTDTSSTSRLATLHGAQGNVLRCELTINETQQLEGHCTDRLGGVHELAGSAMTTTLAALLWAPELGPVAGCEAPQQWRPHSNPWACLLGGC